MPAAPLVVAVSACLLGEPCRYDGRAKTCPAALRLGELAGVAVLPVCPEVAGGFSTPRPPSEVVDGGPDWRVVNSEGADVTDAFARGARTTLDQVRAAGCTLAVLKAKSPACGVGARYDGTFSGTLTTGNGMAADLLLASGIPTIDEARLAQLWESAGDGDPATALRELAASKGAPR